MSFFKRLIPIKAKASISLDKPTFAEGEPIVGKVNIDASEYVQSTGVRIEARAFEHYRDLEYRTDSNNNRVPVMVDKTNTLFSRDVNISGPSDFGQGPTRSFPFTVGIPPVRSNHTGGSVEYQVKGVVCVKGRPDITGTTQIAFTPPVGVTIFAGAPMQQVGYGPPPAYAPQGYAPQGYAPTGYAPQNYPPQGYAPAPATGYAPGPAPAQAYGQPAVAYTQYPQPPPQAKVQVRCKYCQSMIDQGSSVCSNCGAHQ